MSSIQGIHTMMTLPCAFQSYLFHCCRIWQIYSTSYSYLKGIFGLKQLTWWLELINIRCVADFLPHISQLSGLKIYRPNYSLLLPPLWRFPASEERGELIIVLATAPSTVEISCIRGEGRANYSPCYCSLHCGDFLHQRRGES